MFPGREQPEQVLGRALQWRGRVIDAIAGGNVLAPACNLTECIDQGVGFAALRIGSMLGADR
jgi:hypothetical protein